MHKWNFFSKMVCFVDNLKSFILIFLHDMNKKHSPVAIFRASYSREIKSYNQNIGLIFGFLVVPICMEFHSSEIKTIVYIFCFVS